MCFSSLLLGELTCIFFEQNNDFFQFLGLYGRMSSIILKIFENNSKMKIIYRYIPGINDLFIIFILISIYLTLTN